MESPECRAHYLRQPSTLDAKRRGNRRMLQDLGEMSALRAAHKERWHIKTQITAMSWKQIHHEMLKALELFSPAWQRVHGVTTCIWHFFMYTRHIMQTQLCRKEVGSQLFFSNLQKKSLSSTLNWVYHLYFYFFTPKLFHRLHLKLTGAPTNVVIQLSAATLAALLISLWIFISKRSPKGHAWAELLLSFPLPSATVHLGSIKNKQKQTRLRLWPWRSIVRSPHFNIQTLLSLLPRDCGDSTASRRITPARGTDTLARIRAEWSEAFISEPNRKLRIDLRLR